MTAVDPARPGAGRAGGAGSGGPGGDEKGGAGGGQWHLDRKFFRRDPRVVAPELLNKLLVVGSRAGRIVEVEAYCGSSDPGSHTYRGLTPRNAVMFGPPGGLYVYRSYGVHWCANAVCGPEGVGEAVLIRALVPEVGVDEMWAARTQGQLHPLAPRDLCRGPGRLCQALGITAWHNGADLVTGDRGVSIIDDGIPSPARPGVSLRIGLTKGAEHPWRFFVAGDRHVSGPSSHPGTREVGR